MKNATEKKLERVLDVLKDIRTIIQNADGEDRFLTGAEQEVVELVNVTLKAVRP